MMRLVPETLMRLELLISPSQKNVIAPEAGKVLHWHTFVAYEPRFFQNGQRVMQSRHELREKIFGTESINAAVNVLAEVLSQVGISSFATGYVAGPVHEPNGQWRKFEHQVINFPKAGTMIGISSVTTALIIMPVSTVG